MPQPGGGVQGGRKPIVGMTPHRGFGPDRYWT